MSNFAKELKQDMNNNTSIQLASNDELLIYQSEDGTIKVDVLFQDETVWLAIENMCLLFRKARSTINEHILNVFSEREIEEEFEKNRNFRLFQHSHL